MKFPACAALATLTAVVSCQSPAQDGIVPKKPLVIAAGKAVDSLPNEPHLKNVRQLTFDGQNAEGYWSNDGRKVILQRRSDDMPADQIYVLDMSTGEMQRVSTGKGKTTCSYFLQGDNQIVFASTHHTGDAPPVVKRTGRGYEWEVHQEFDLFVAKPDGSELKALTDSPGYDAEATVCPVTGAIVSSRPRR
jgi:Tol biopolymer transport system component